jgi:hypothetical protein
MFVISSIIGLAITVAATMGRAKTDDRQLSSEQIDADQFSSIYLGWSRYRGNRSDVSLTPRRYFA